MELETGIHAGNDDGRYAGTTEQAARRCVSLGAEIIPLQMRCFRLNRQRSMGIVTLYEEIDISYKRVFIGENDKKRG